MEKKILTIALLIIVLVSCKETPRQENPETSKTETIEDSTNETVKNKGQQSLKTESNYTIEKILNGLQPGTRKDSLIHLGKRDSMGLTIIKGVEDGPVFSIVAGIHGYEYPPIIAVQNLLRKIDPQKLKGTLLVIPIANEAAFFQRSVYINPLDGKNLNRVFPGNDQGTVTEKIAAYISTEIIPASDVFLDIHGGDANEDLLPFVCFYNRTDKPQQVALAKRLTRSAGFEYNVVYPYHLASNQPSEYAFKEAVQQGKTALSIESGKLGNVHPEFVELIEQGVLNMLKEIRMYPGNKMMNGNQKWLENQYYIKCPAKGLFYSAVKSGEKVVKGQSLGYITDIFGVKITNIEAPETGIVLYKTGTPPVNKEETLFCIGN